MPVIISCPDCGAQFDLIQAFEDADGRRLLDMIKDLPPVVIKPYFRYLKLFKPAKQSLRWSRMLKLTAEIAPMIKAAQIEHERTVYVVPASIWATTMTTMVDTPPKSLKLPLKGHGYLFTILASQAEKAAGKQEQEQINKARFRSKEGNGDGLQKVDGQALYEAHMQRLHKGKKNA